MNDDQLRDSLGEIAESVTNVDMYDRALTRSRRIGRNRAMAVTGSAMAVLGLAGFGLWGWQPSQLTPPPPAAASSTLPVPSTAPAPSPSAGTSASESTPPAPLVPRSRSLADLPGEVYYRDDSTSQVVRLRADGSRTPVLPGLPDSVAVSPDGTTIAALQGGALRLNGGKTPIATGLSIDQQDLAWSPDGTKLLVGNPRPGILTVATGRITALPTGLGGRFYRWSGDGQRLVSVTPACRLQTAGSTATSGTTVPLIGDPDSSRNPDGSAACSLTSVDRSGDRAVILVGAVGGTSAAAMNSGSGSGDALVDLHTGEVVGLPVAGSVLGMAYDQRGNLLIKARTGGAVTLSVIDPAGALLVQATEPAQLADLTLLAFSR